MGRLALRAGRVPGETDHGSNPWTTRSVMCARYAQRTAALLSSIKLPVVLFPVPTTIVAAPCVCGVSSTGATSFKYYETHKILEPEA